MEGKQEQRPHSKSWLQKFIAIFFTEKIWWVFIVIITLLSINWLVDRLSYISLEDARIEADIVMLSVPVDAQIIDIQVASGNAVVQGQTLAILDSKRATLQYQQDFAAVQEHEFIVSRLEQDLEQQRNRIILENQTIQLEINQQKSMVEASKTSLAIEVAKLMRQKDLSEKNLIPILDVEIQQEIHDRQSWALKGTQIKLALIKKKKQQLQLDQQELSLLEAELNTKKSIVQRLKAKAAYSESLLQEHILLSPIDGIVDGVFMDVGEFTQRSRPVIAIHNPHSVWVSANVQEANLQDLSEGMQATVVIDAYDSKQYNVILTRIKHIANNQLSIIPNTNPSGNFVRIAQRVNLKFEFKDLPPGYQLKPGLLVKVKIPRP